MNDEFELTSIEPEEEQIIPSTGIDGYERPVLFFTTEDPREIINLDAGNLRVDTDAVIKNDLTVEGNTGIGTTNPSQKLEVIGNIKSSGSIVSTEGFTSQTGGSPILISVTGNTITLSVTGIGSTTLTLS